MQLDLVLGQDVSDRNVITVLFSCKHSPFLLSRL